MRIIQLAAIAFFALLEANSQAEQIHRITIKDKGIIEGQVVARDEVFTTILSQAGITIKVRSEAIIDVEISASTEPQDYNKYNSDQTTDDFWRLIQSIAPEAATEKWLEIPWRTNISLARREASASDKPLFVWQMVGSSPLGST